MGVNKRLVQMNNLPINPAWHKQVRILLRRNFQEHIRESQVLITSLVQTIVIAALIGTVFLRIGQTQQSIVRRGPVLFFCAINQGMFGALMVINSFPVERALTLRERASGTYFASAYFIAKIVADTLVQIPVPIIFVSTPDRLALIHAGSFLVVRRLLHHWAASDGRQVLSLHAVHVPLLAGGDIACADDLGAVQDHGNERDGLTHGARSVPFVRWLLLGAITPAEVLRLARCPLVCEVHLRWHRSQ